RYVFTEFVKIFIATAIGFPVLVIVIDITENLDKYLARKLTMVDIAQAYVFSVPETMSLVLPAAVLFATVFSICPSTRHAETTAAKAGGISFHRFILPIAMGAAFATGLDLLLTMATPPANARRNALLQDRRAADALGSRFNFTFASEEGRVYV